MEGRLPLAGPAGAVLVASWLVEAKQSAIENMAPELGLLLYSIPARDSDAPAEGVRLGARAARGERPPGA